MINDFAINETEETIENFCLFGDHDFIDENGDPRIKNNNSDKIVAKIIYDKRSRQIVHKTKNKTYMIKVNPKLEVFNPVKTLSAVKNKQSNHFINNICKSEWYFKEVDMHIFEKYINFLKTGNVKLLKNIERDLK